MDAMPIMAIKKVPVRFDQIPSRLALVSMSKLSSAPGRSCRRDRNTNVGGARKPKQVRHGAKTNMVQKERKDRRARKNRRDKKER